jgi:PAS domain S-box-containing protein
MEDTQRKSGIDTIGDIPWGTHICQFYQTKDDLIDILVPYLKAGLENNEFCMWITSEPLGVNEAKASLYNAVRDLDDYISKGQIEILDYREWYTKSGKFNSDEVLHGWIEKEREALEKGFKGLRISGNNSWLGAEDWVAFREYEAVVDSIIGEHRMIAICTYSMNRCAPSEVLDVLNNHETHLIKRKGVWRTVETDERKRLKKVLLASEVRFRRLFETAQDGILILDADTGRITDSNPYIKDILGYTTEELLNKRLWEIGLFKDIAKSKGAFKVLQREGYIRFEDLQLKTKDGKPVDVEFVSNVYDVDHKKIIQCNIREISERKEAAKVSEQYKELLEQIVEQRTRELTESNRKLLQELTDRKKVQEKLKDEATRHRILIDESSDGIVILDENGKVYEANRCFAKMLGYTPKEVRKLNVWDWEFQYPPEQVAEMIRTVDETGDHFETKHRRKDGTVFDVEISTNGAVYAGQKLIFCVCRDITERKKAEEKLRQAAEEWRTTFDSISDLVSIHDKDFKIVRVNKACADALNMKPEELIGKTCYQVVHGTNEPVSSCPHMETLKTKKSAKGEFFEPHLGIHLEVATSPIFNDKGEVVASVHVARDITERKKMQEQLVITDRLASVGELAAGIAHELNNPLTGVIGFSQLLLEKEMPEDVKQDIQMIYQEAQRTSQVVKNLLTFARKHAAVKEKVNINEIIKKVLELRAYEQNLENIIVDARFAPELPEVMVDYFQLQQVFLNIIINAEYFMKEAHHGGKLTITTERVDNRVRVSIADDGPGIARENLGHLFDPFFTTKEVGKGTGLGLSICHGIVAEHGGRIYVESELGKGATFIVELPIGAVERRKGGAL